MHSPLWRWCSASRGNLMQQVFAGPEIRILPPPAPASFSTVLQLVWCFPFPRNYPYLYQRSIVFTVLAGATCLITCVASCFWLRSHMRRHFHARRYFPRFLAASLSCVTGLV